MQICSVFKTAKDKNWNLHPIACLILTQVKDLHRETSPKDNKLYVLLYFVFEWPVPA